MNKFILGMTLSLGLFISLIPYPSLGIEQKSERTFFRKSPRLLDVITTFKGARITIPTYYYTINLPDQSGESLQKITIQKRQGFEIIEYYPNRTIAFQGTPDDRGQPLTVKESIWDETTETMTVILSPPVPPGTTFTVGLKAIRNPEHGGIYLFGVNVFPSGENPMNLYLGSGRLDFYGSDSGSFD
ncbi:DUF2808 domain-containing protein [Crocosphaera sp. UHCC 0190]|uniref:DUF2808 domain-containing protein n=1 Tax=Crocosphaera sp. UHCC 0190 TaxID=3110246 RepID=UPI002B20A765|nr:DUF2808 domain-containing protein [Crocosphaera sp. UHCC 0190]MEA5509222.1 DUF2808 domain-containing protein [Crocosphaera sp. UHCC 0190]